MTIFCVALDRFYQAIERAAATINDFSQKTEFPQHGLRAVFSGLFGRGRRYARGGLHAAADCRFHGEKRGSDIKDRIWERGIPHLYGQRTRTAFLIDSPDRDVHIIDPFVGTGNFIVRTMREIRPTALEEKYKGELHCNEVMLLPYYIASMNIEHEFYETMGAYRPFEGICLVDTFELAEDRQLPLFAPENTPAR